MAAVALDSNVLGMLTHPRRSGDAPRCRRWLDGLLDEATDVLLSDLTDYELRRELVRINSLGAIARLDALGEVCVRLPVTAPVLRHAADLWATARQRGMLTAHPKSLDVDVILAAQLQLYTFNYGTAVTLATTNVRHLGQFVDARPWQDIHPG